MARTPSSSLTAGDRKQIERRIVDKFKLIKQSICTDQIDPEQIKQQMLAQKGVIVPSAELAVQHKDLQRQRDEMIEPHIQAARNALTLRLSELDAQKKEEMQTVMGEFRQQLTALKTRVQAQKRDLENRYSAEREELQAGLERVRMEQLDNHAKDITKKLDDLKRREIEVSQMEREIDLISKSRISLLKRQAGRINQIVDDAQNRILEKLMFTDDRSEAKTLLEGVPTVASVLESLNDGAEGVTTLLSSINPEATKAMNNAPRLAMTAPSEPVQDVTAAAIVTKEEAGAEAGEDDETEPYRDSEVENAVSEAVRSAEIS